MIQNIGIVSKCIIGTTVERACTEIGQKKYICYKLNNINIKYVNIACARRRTHRDITISYNLKECNVHEWMKKTRWTFNTSTKFQQSVTMDNFGIRTQKYLKTYSYVIAISRFAQKEITSPTD